MRVKATTCAVFLVLTGLFATAAFLHPARAQAPAAVEAERRQQAACAGSGAGSREDCVPNVFDTFDIPFAELPGGRMDAQGTLDATSSPEDAHAGAFVAARRLGLFRNFEWVHWLPTAPSTKDPNTGAWSGGDLDGFPTGWGSTGLGIAGDCLYWGRSNSTNTTGPGVTRDVIIYRIQPNPEVDHPSRSAACRNSPWPAAAALAGAAPAVFPAVAVPRLAGEVPPAGAVLPATPAGAALPAL